MMDFKKIRIPKPKVEPEPVEKNYIVLSKTPDTIFGNVAEFYSTLEEATKALHPNDLGVYKLVARAKFNKVVEDVE